MMYVYIIEPVMYCSVHAYHGTHHGSYNVPIVVAVVPQGKLDFASYPERLMITDIVPNMISGVLFAQCLQVHRKVQ